MVFTSPFIPHQVSNLCGALLLASSPSLNSTISHRFISYDLSSIRVSLLVLSAFISTSSATPQLNVTVNHAHPSIIYWPPTSWITLATNTNDASSGCFQRQQQSTFHAAFTVARQEKVEEPGSIQVITGRTGPSRVLDNQRIPTWSPTFYQPGRSECDASDIVPQGHLDGGHWPITFRFKFIGEPYLLPFAPRYCLAHVCF